MRSSSPARAVTVTVPATSANLGPGFDCLGLALDLRNEVTASAGGPLVAAGERATVYDIHVAGVDADKVPAGRDNLVVDAAELIFRRVGRRPARMAIRQYNRIPVASGLGSSSTAIVAGLVAANALTGGELPDGELLRMAVEREGHPDNVAPALLGGLVLGVLPDAADGPDALIVRRMEPPPLSAVVVLPDFHLLTSEARAVLPPAVSRADAIFNAGRLALLLHDLQVGNFDCLRVAMADRLHQSHRFDLIPGARAALAAAYDAGALGVALSGAGPSLLALAAGGEPTIRDAMRRAFEAAGLASRGWILAPSAAGVRLVEAENIAE